MRPIQFSTLKALDPLDQKPERGENHDGQSDVEQVPHVALLGVHCVRRLARRPARGETGGGGVPACTGTFQVAPGRS